MFDFRMKKVLSVILSSCTLGCLSSLFAVNGTENIEVTKVEANAGTAIVTSNNSQLTQGSLGDAVVNYSGSSTCTLLGNAIIYGQDSNLIKEGSVLPGVDDNFELYIRAVKVKDGLGNSLTYDPYSGDPTKDSGWIKCKGLGTLNFLRSSAGLWKTFCVRYLPNDKCGDYSLTRIVLDESRSTPERNVYNLYDKDNKAIVPDVS